MPNKARPPLTPVNQPQSFTPQLRRTHCQRHSPNSSPLLPQGQNRSRPPATVTPNQMLPSVTTVVPTRTTTSMTTKGHRNGKHHHFFSNHQSNNKNNNQQQQQHTFFNNNHNHYYSSKLDRSINNCEKFLPDHDLNSSMRENDLLLIHAKQAKRSV